MKLIRRVCLGMMACYTAIAASLEAQSIPVEYAVKFACGARQRSNQRFHPSQSAVLPGYYATAINIHNPGSDTARIHVDLATTDSLPVPGKVISWERGLVLPPGQALEVDCEDILKSRSAEFVKGFAVLSNRQELNVTAVYTAGRGTFVDAIDVEAVLPTRLRRSSRLPCPDLLIRGIETPAYTDGTTQLTVQLANAGTLRAANVELQVEDGSGLNADRVAKVIVASIDPGSQQKLKLVLPYLVPRANWPALAVTVDPKHVIPECREDNNRATLAK